MPAGEHIEFGEFVIDADDNVFDSEERPLQLSPKALLVLREFLKRPGKLVTKTELLDSVWPDSFVEEGNLKFTISLLRRSLGDDAQRPRYIETVARRGYKFVADVRIVDTHRAPIGRVARSSVDAKSSASTSNGLWWLRLGAAAILIAGIVSGVLYLGGTRSNATGKLLTSQFSSERLLTGGVPTAVLSADGNTVVYLLEQAKKYGIWLRQMDTGANLELVPATEDTLSTIEISHDGAFVYFSRARRDSKVGWTIDRVSSRGGIPSTVISGTDARFSLSTDGRLSYTRCSPRPAKDCSLYIANADGSGERKLVTRDDPQRITTSQISPDGSRIAFAAGHADTRSDEFGLYEVDLATGLERPLAKNKFFNIRGIRWLSDGSSLVITALIHSEFDLGIWSVTASTGEAVRLTRDAGNYSGISIDQANDLLLATTVTRDFQILLIDALEPSSRRELVSAIDGRFGPDGRIYFSSMITGNPDIWTINVDGSAPRQLTNSSREDLCPEPSPTGTFIAFASNESGEQHVYRINMDGSGRRRLTESTGGVPKFISEDGQWIYFRSAADKSLWRVSADGSEESRVLNSTSDHYAYSAKSGKIAYAAAAPNRELLVADLDQGRQERSFSIPGHALALAWDQHHDAVLCAIRTAPDRAELWRYPLDGTPAAFITNLTDALLVNISQSPDGRYYAVIEGELRHEAILIRGLR